MKFSVRQFCGSFMALFLGLVFILPSNLAAQSQQVTPAELRNAVQRSAGERQRNLSQVRSFFADPKVAKILTDARLDSVRIDKTLSTLNAGDLSKLAARTARVQGDFAAGSLSNQELTYVVLAIGVAVLVLILVS